MSLESVPSRGEGLARKAVESGNHLYSCEDPRVQVFLAKLAYPNDANPMLTWTEGNAEHPALSGIYRAYIEAHQSAFAGTQIDVTDYEAMEKLLEAVRTFTPETRH